MANRLQPLNVFDFTGGVNLRPESFQLQENELPELVNLEVDPRGGLNTRKGWQGVTTPATTGAWDPRSAFLHRTSTGIQTLYTVNQGHLLAQQATTWTDMGTGCVATPHGADFADWGDKLYVTRGRTSTSLRVVGTGSTTMTASGAANWANDYTAPGAPTMPQAELVASHAGYLFTANVQEDGTAYSNRLRWSHPNNPEAWAFLDYVDISDGGQRITALVPFSDRLLIFKPDSVWALFGYDAETWDVTNLTRTVGAYNPQVVCRSENAVFFMSWPHGVFGYTEENSVEELSVQIRTLFQDQWMSDAAIVNSWLGWVGRRLWVSVPYSGVRPGPADAESVFVFDPVLGSWTQFEGVDGNVPGPYVERIEAREPESQLAFVRNTAWPVVLDAITAVANDECEPGVPLSFPTRLRTRWIDAGAPTWKKSWRRPDFLLRGLTIDTIVNVRVFHDFDNFNAQRSFLVAYTPEDSPALWGEFVYGDGTTYGGSSQTSSVERGGTMGRAGSVQVTLDGNPGVLWGINGIVFKYIPRRFR